MKLSNLIKPSKYFNKIRFINESIKKSKCIRKLINTDFLSTSLSNVWKLEKDNVKIESPFDISEYNIFGNPISLNNINWHKDYVSGFEYPKKRFDKIRISKWFNGADSPVVLMIDSLANLWFDLNGNGRLDPGEDWGYWRDAPNSSFYFLRKTLVDKFPEVKITYFTVVGNPWKEQS